MRENWDWKTHRRCGGQSSHSPKHDELCERKVRIEEIEDGSGSGETLETKRIEGIGGIGWETLESGRMRVGEIQSRERRREASIAGEKKIVYKCTTTLQPWLYHHLYIFLKFKFIV